MEIQSIWKILAKKSVHKSVHNRYFAEKTVHRQCRILSIIVGHKEGPAGYKKIC